MKKFKLVLISILALLTFASCETESIESDLINEKSTALTSKKVEKSKLQNRVINSDALKGNFVGNTFARKLQIYTPPGYKKNGTQQYPVVYLLHGFPFSEKTFIERDVWDEWITPYLFTQEYPDFPEEGFRLWVDNLIAEGSIEPIIIVMPDASTEPYGFSFYTNSVFNGDFEDFIVHDLVNYMDNNYNTMANAPGRAVIGHSQGGYAAFKFGMLHPDVFGTVASHSGLLLADAFFDPMFIDLLEQENQGGFTGPDPTKFLTSAMYAMSAAWSPNLNNPPFYVDLPLEFHAQDAFNTLNGIYLDVGIADELLTQLAHEPVISKLDFFNIDYTFETYDGGHHSNLFERLAVALEFCSNNMN
jgi:S-formylglutathione hydrolase FrmB